MMERKTERERMIEEYEQKLWDAFYHDFGLGVEDHSRIAEFIVDVIYELGPEEKKRPVRCPNCQIIFDANSATVTEGTVYYPVHKVYPVEITAIQRVCVEE